MVVVSLPFVTLGCFNQPPSLAEQRRQREREQQRAQAEREEELRLETQRTPQEQRDYQDDLRKRLGDAALNPGHSAQIERDLM